MLSELILKPRGSLNIGAGEKAATPVDSESSHDDVTSDENKPNSGQSSVDDASDVEAEPSSSGAEGSEPTPDKKARKPSKRILEAAINEVSAITIACNVSCLEEGSPLRQQRPFFPTNKEPPSNIKQQRAKATSGVKVRKERNTNHDSTNNGEGEDEDGSDGDQNSHRHNPRHNDAASTVGIGIFSAPENSRNTSRLGQIFPH